MHIKEKAKYLIKYFLKKKRDIIPKSAFFITLQIQRQQYIND